MRKYQVMSKPCSERRKMLKWLFFLSFAFASCSTTIKTTKDERVPEELRYFLKIGISYDSISSGYKKIFTVAERTKITLYTFEYNLKDNQLVGKLNVKGGSTEFLEDKGKDFEVNLKATHCCTNHNPNDCVHSTKEKEEYTKTKQCSGWVTYFH